MRRMILTLGLAAALASPSSAQVFTVGSTLAHSCYESARDQNGSDEALRTCTLALSDPKSRPDEVATFVNRGIVQFLRGKYEASINDFDAAIRRDPAEAEAYLNKAIVLLRRPDGPAQAVPLFSASLERNTRKPALAYLGRGMAHELSGNVKAAYADYKQAKQLAPRWAAADAELSRFQVVRN